MPAKVIGTIPWLVDTSFECYKVKYDTHQEAMNASLRKSSQKKQKINRPYKCEHCGKFHLTSERKRKK